MPVHDWTRVEDGAFHALHGAWITSLRAALNNGLLPEGYYAIGDAMAGDANPDVLTLLQPGPAGNGHIGSAVTLAVAAPRVSVVSDAVRESYTHRQRSLLIRRASGHRPVAVIEIVSAGNKGSEYSFDTFITKVLGGLGQGIHQLVLDLHPPGQAHHSLSNVTSMARTSSRKSVS